jgi:hypothetical protein
MKVKKLEVSKQVTSSLTLNTSIALAAMQW